MTSDVPTVTLAQSRLDQILRQLSRAEQELEDERRSNAELRRLLNEARAERDRALAVGRVAA